MPIILLILLSLGVGTTALAEKSLPGDALYPVKIHVNENLDSLVAVGAKNDALTDIKHISKRLDEAKQLKEKGDLTSEKTRELNTEFAESINSARRHIDDLNKKGGDTVSSKEIENELEEKNSEHVKLFAQFSGTSTSTEAVVKVRGEDSRGEFGEEKSEKKSISNQGVRRDDDEEGDDDDDNRVQTGATVVTPVAKVTTNTSSTAKTFTLAQVAEHNTKTSCYTTIQGSVYDLTTWIAQHPGGQSAIIGLCGIEGTKGFMQQHGGQGNPERELASLKIGVLAK